MDNQFRIKVRNPISSLISDRFSMRGKRTIQQVFFVLLPKLTEVLKHVSRSSNAMSLLSSCYHVQA